MTTLHFIELLLILFIGIEIVNFVSPFGHNDEDIFYSRTFIVLILLSLMCVWFCSIGDSQRAPHHVVSRLGSQVVADYWTTNPVYYTYVQNQLFIDGHYQVVRQTNYLWHVWKIFR